MYTKLIKRNLKLITLINNTWLFLDSTQSNLNVEPSVARIHEVLKEKWLFEHNFQIETLTNVEFLGVSNLSTNCS